VNQTPRIRKRSSISKKKWASYAAAAAAAVSIGTHTAEADIIHVVVGAPTGTLSADQGGSQYFQLYHPALNINVNIELSHVNLSTYSTNGAAFLNVGYGAAFIGAAGNGRQYVSNLASGFLVSGGGFLGSIGIAGTLAYSAYNSGAQFLNAGSGYIGFRFNDADDVQQHGWIRVTLDGAPLNSLTIEEFAFTTRGESIAVGQVPEPGSLGLLALGALGLMCTRSRKPGNN